MTTTTRMASRYRMALEQLRDAVDHRAHSLSPLHRKIVHDYVNNLAGLLANGFEPTEELTLEQAAELDARCKADFCVECGRFEAVDNKCKACGTVSCCDCSIAPATIETSHGQRCIDCAKAYGEPRSTRPPAPQIGHFFETLKSRLHG